MEILAFSFQLENWWRGLIDFMYCSWLSWTLIAICPFSFSFLFCWGCSMVKLLLINELQRGLKLFKPQIKETITLIKISFEPFFMLLENWTACHRWRSYGASGLDSVFVTGAASAVLMSRRCPTMTISQDIVA